MTEKLLSENRQLVKKFVRATLKGIVLPREQPQVAARVAEKHIRHETGNRSFGSSEYIFPPLVRRTLEDLPRQASVSLLCRMLNRSASRRKKSELAILQI